MKFILQISVENYQHPPRISETEQKIHMFSEMKPAFADPTVSPHPSFFLKEFSRQMTCIYF
jgi:hypothetical protein